MSWGQVLQDVRYAPRTLRKNPAFTLMAALTLALGIGANTAIFSVVHGVLLSPLPFARPERIVRLEETHRDIGRVNLTGATFLDLRERNRSFSHLAAFRSFPTPYSLVSGARPESVPAGRVTEDFFEVLGVPPLRGRLFRPADFHPGAAPVVIISESLWRRVFGSDPDAVGRMVKLDDAAFTVIGVLPGEIRYPAFAGIWIPLRQGDIPQSNRNSHLFGVVGRLAPDVSIEQAQAEMRLLAEQIDRESGQVDAGLGLVATTLHDRLVEPVRPALLALMGAVGLLLLVACVNVASLSLARGVSREREMAVRAALGATRGRLAGQILAESTMLALVGGGLGVFLAWWGVKALTALAPADLPRLDAVSLDGTVLAFAFAASLVTAVLFGLWPAWQASRTDLQAAMQEGARGSAGGARHRWRQVLVASEVALALVLLTGATLLGRSFAELLRVHLGYDPENVVTFNVSPSKQRYETLEAKAAFFDRLVERLAPLPGVQSVALSSGLPTRGIPSTTFEPEGRPALPADQELGADVIAVSPEYFRTMRIPLIRGRGFDTRDRQGAPVVIVVSETTARRFWPGEDPIGKRVTMKHWDDPLPAEVIGIAADVHQRALDEPIEPAVYFSYRQFVDRIFGLYVLTRTSVPPSSLAPALASRVWAVDHDQPLADLRTLEDVLAVSVAQQRFNTLVLGVFAVLGVLLALVGIFGVMSHAVNQRTQEIGIRMALGAQRGRILRLVIRQGMLPAAVGMVIGVAGGLAAGQLLSSLLFNIEPTDAATYAAVVVLLFAVALLACYVPARRATRVDPMIALRYE